MSSAPLLSIVTPTYNRAHLLKNCFASLQNQTDSDFEWIIVDDGSTDNTQEIVSTFQSDLFPVISVRKENGGKHTALNTAMEHVRGQYVLILDSDDMLTEDAVSLIRNKWKSYANDQNVAVLILLRGHSKADPLCTGTICDQPTEMLRYKRRHIHSSDCCEVIRADVMRQFPFPVFENERFLSEGALWNRVALQYQCVYVNEVIYICEYLEGGLTKSGRGMRIRNPKGGMYSSKLNMHPRNYFSRRVKNGLLYCCYGFFAGLSPRSILAETPYKLLVLLCLLPGWLLFLYWGNKHR